MKPGKPATYEDIVDLPEWKVGEIVDGELYVSPRPAPRHSLAESVLGTVLSGPFQFGTGGPGGWWILDEPEIHSAGDVLVPDLAGWRRERMPTVPETAFFELAPDWLCEVLSPSTERLDRSKKLRRYAKMGVAHIWLVNPVLRTLEALRLVDGKWLLVATHAGDERVRAEPFEAVELDLLLLWEGRREP
ncbi:MAG TPA: Uma2 family endonuclease [Myxococcales bacterium]|jgi:Uma2 family endonuclease